MHPPPSLGECDWTIHYGKWISSFQPGIYRPGGKSSGAACLEACCKDPTCTGLQLESTMDSQCYKYTQVPVELHGDRGTPLTEYVNAPRQPAWSVFVKASAAGIDPRAAPPSLLLREEDAKLPALRAQQEEAALDAKLERELEPPHSCEWTVYYDKWMPSFQGGEYEHNNAFGGAHCLKACCEDPSCKGLAMESNEMYQCYKYGTLPSALGSMRGRQLGDGAWLRHERTAWSIMVKSERPLPAALPRPVTEGAQHAVVQAPSSTWHWASILAHALALLTMVALLASSLMGTLQRAEILGRKRFASRRDPEAAGLLEAVQPQK